MGHSQAEYGNTRTMMVERKKRRNEANTNRLLIQRKAYWEAV
jgi:hypothetical protein